MDKYFTAENLGGPIRRKITAIKQEEVDGVPRIVLYFADEPRGLLLTRELAEELTKAYGPHPLVEKFFNLH